MLLDPALSPKKELPWPGVFDQAGVVTKEGIKTRSIVLSRKAAKERIVCADRVGLSGRGAKERIVRAAVALTCIETGDSVAGSGDAQDPIAADVVLCCRIYGGGR